MSDKDSVKNITMSVIKEFNKGLLGESIDFLMIKREDLQFLIDGFIYVKIPNYQRDIQGTINNYKRIKEEYNL